MASDVPALAVLSDDVAVVGRVVDLLELHDISVVQLAQQRDLALEHVLEAYALLLAHVDHLDADNLAYAGATAYQFGR